MTASLTTIKLSYLLLFLFLAGNIQKLPAQSQLKKVEVFANIEANDTLQKIINILEGQLQKSNGVIFSIKPLSAYNNSGICLINLASDRETIKKVTTSHYGITEKYTVIADNETVLISANSNMAVGHGVFAWLEKLGFRYYFAHPDWYIIPSKPQLFSKFSFSSSPSFHHRRIFYEYGTGSQKADQDFVFWQLANKMGGTLNAMFGHAYDDIVLRNKEVFKEHPEWFYPVPAKGVLPDDPKFDMTKEDLVQFIIQDVTKRIDISIKNKAPLKMISLGASDGRGTCNSPECQKLGTITDRVYYLVNRVAKAIQNKYPGTYIGCLAYDQYGDPPTIKLEPNIYIAITTAFNASKYSTEELITRWRIKGAKVGIYDYFSQFTFDYDIPGQSQASEIKKLTENIRKYHSMGVVGYEGQSSPGWINKGLGYYICAKLMWDLNTDVESIRKEFFNNCFGKASGTMKRLWKEWEEYGFTQVRETDLARWIDLAEEAGREETTPQVHNRLLQVKTYLHYLYMFRKYQAAKTEANLLQLLNYGYRTLEYGSVIGYPAFFELGNRSGIPGMGYGPDAKWRSNDGLVAGKEINRLIQEDRSQLKVAAPVQVFDAVTAFKKVPNLDLSNKLFADSAQGNNAFWLTDEWVLEIKNKGSFNFFDFTGDYIGNKTVTKPIKIRIYKYKADGNISLSKPIITYDYKAEQVKEKISLGGLVPGLYTMLIEDPVKIYRLKFSPSVNYSVVMRPKRQIQTTALTYAFIYVPEGVQRFNVIKSRVIDFVTPAGRIVNLDDESKGEVQVEVKKGESGLWRIKLLADKLYIEGIPPYLGTSPSQMLIPANVK